MNGGILDLVLQRAPLWVVAILIVASCLGARELGYWLRGRVKAAPDASSDPAYDYVVGAIFGLLAFILGFTFSIAIERFDTRRGMVAEEASAIRSLYVTADLLDQPFASDIKHKVRDYAATRIAPKGLWSGDHDPALAESRALKLKMLASVHTGIRPIRDTDLATYLAELANETVNVGQRRELVGRTHIPNRILDVLLLYTLVSAAVLGFQISRERRGLRLASSLLLILYCVAFSLIIDLDRPQAGTILVAQTAMEELNSELRREADRPSPASAKEQP